jgi:hypothetical protein
MPGTSNDAQDYGDYDNQSNDTYYDQSNNVVSHSIWSDKEGFKPIILIAIDSNLELKRARHESVISWS